MKTRLLLPLFALLPAAACDPTGGHADDDGIVEPDLDGKMDEFSGVEDGGVLRFEQTVDGEFEEDFQFFEYTFRAREDAEVTIEITQAGSSRGLDTTLFLYRNEPQGRAPTRIASDDDDGWGALSRIRDFRLYSEDEYTIVVGTKDATGRGRFRLSLGCDSGECGPTSEPLECHPVFESALVDCITEGNYETDFELHAYELVEECAESTSYGAEEICPDPAEEVCLDPAAGHQACLETWTAAYVRPATGLAEDDDVGLDALVESVWDAQACSLGEDAGCTFDAALFRYDAQVPSTPELLAFARARSEVGPGAYLEQDLDAEPSVISQVFGNYRVEDEFAAFLADAGLDISEAQVASSVSFREFLWNWGECSGGVFAVTFPSAQRVLVVEDLFCYG